LREDDHADENVITAAQNRQAAAAHMSSAEDVARALDTGARRGNGGWSCRCPAHDDHHASLSLSDGHDGRLLWRCHAGCDQDKVQAELKRRGLLGKPNGHDRATDVWRPIMPVPQDAPKPTFRHDWHGHASLKWTYRNAEGELLFYAVRFDLPGGSKQILPRCYGSLDGRSGWYWRAAPVPRPLYRLKALADRPEALVLVVEGEKTALAASKRLHDFAVTTWPGGALATAKADWSPLEGRDVTIWPDHDAPGKKAARAVAAQLHEVGADRVRIVELPLTPELPEGWDLADPWPQDLGDPVELIRRAGTVTPEAVADDDDGADDQLIRRSLSEVQEREVDWLWPDTLAIGEVHTWAGEPDVGKSTALASIAASITRGRSWPDGGGKAPSGECLFLTLENDPATTLRPRLRVAGARLSKCYEVGAVRDGEFESLDNLVNFERLDQALTRWPKTLLVAIDPVFDFVATTKVNSAAEVRAQVIKPLTRLARRHGVAIVLIIHLNKVQGQSARQRVSGADAWTTAPRIAHLFGEHPQHEGVRVMATLRNSLAKDKRAPAYTLQDHDGYPKAVWREERMHVSPEELVQPPTSKVEQCETWLKAHLADGPQPAKEVREAAKKAGFKPWQLRQATKNLVIKRSKPDFTSGWVWELPS
jgi:hypothetical protein